MPAEISFSELVDVNPRRLLKSGQHYPYVEMAAVPEGGGRPTHHEEREFTGGGSRFAVGDTLFARITPCTENGKLAYVDRLPVGEVGFGSTELIVIAAKPGRADPRFVYQVAASARVREQAISRMLGTSGRQRVPTWYFTEELTVPDIPLPEQRAIAAVLDAVDDTIERTEAVIAATEELRRALLHELLTRGVPGMHSEWTHVPGLGTVPACWEVTTLGELLSELRYGTSTKLSARGTWPVLRIPNVARGFVDLSDLKYADLTEREGVSLELRPGDLLIVRTNGNPDICGASAVWQGAEGRWGFASYLLRLRMRAEMLNSTFLWMYLRSAAGRRQLAGSIRTSAGNYNLGAEGLRAMLVPVPSLEEQSAMRDIVRGLDAIGVAELDALSDAKIFKTSLAEALLSGRTQHRAAFHA